MMGLKGYWRAIWTAASAMPRLRRKVAKAGLCCNAHCTAPLSVSVNGGFDGSPCPSHTRAGDGSAGSAPSEKRHETKQREPDNAKAKAARDRLREGGLIIPHSVNVGEPADGVK